MTTVQIGVALWISVLVAIFHTCIHEKWAAYFRRVVEADLEAYKSMLEDARTKLEMLAKLSAEKKLTAKVWSDPIKYVDFCRDSVENCNGVVSVVTGYLNQNQHYFTKGANDHLKKFTKHLKNRIREMEEVIDASK